MLRRHAPMLCPVLLVFLCLAACGRSADRPGAGVGAGRTLSWIADRHVRGVVDLSAPRRDGSIVIAAAGRLAVLASAGGVRQFASGYAEQVGLEPYIALSSGRSMPAARCTFGRDSLYVLKLTHGAGVTVVDPRGRVRLFVSLPNRGLENGIAFDDTGGFGHRLLVTAVAMGKTTVYAIDCRGQVETVTSTAPRLEGGIAVAPRTFGRVAGELIAPDELSGRLLAIRSDGRATVIADSGLPHGQDTGIESAGFVPARFGAALVADRLTPGNPHPGDDLILGIRRVALAGAGVRAGDLLVATEAGAKLVAVSCRASCHVRHVADGPAAAHVEGHLVFTSG